MSSGSNLWGEKLKCQQYMNIFKVERLNDADFNYMVKKAGTFIQPSVAEGYGHSVNEGRCNGANVITTDAPSMNELVKNKSLLLAATCKTKIWKIYNRPYMYKSDICAYFIKEKDFAKKMKKYLKLSATVIKKNAKEEPPRFRKGYEIFLSSYGEIN